jgi:hypothetical protein
VLVDHRRSDALVTHPRHQVAQARSVAAARVLPVAAVREDEGSAPPIAATAFRQFVALLKLLRRNTPPRWPETPGHLASTQPNGPAAAGSPAGSRMLRGPNIY